MSPSVTSRDAHGNRARREPVAALRAVALGLVLLAVSLQTVHGLTSPLVRAQGHEVASDARPTQTRVRIEVLGTQWQRPTGDPQASTYVTLAAGERATRYLTAGDTEDANLCVAGFVNEPSSGQAAYVWRLDVQALAVTSTHSTVTLRWARSRGRLADGQAEAGDTRTLTLGVGDYQIFDYVSAPPGSSSCANLVLRVLADPLPQRDPQPLLAVDLWLSQEGRTGPQWLHQRVSGRSGQPLQFRLERLEWQPDGAMGTRTADRPTIGLEVNGTIQAILRPDGFLDVAATINRSLSWGRALVRGEGRQEFRCAIGEAVGILLPDPRGQARTPITSDLTPPFAEGVFAQGDKTMTVDFARFFAGSQALLYIVIRQQP